MAMELLKNLSVLITDLYNFLQGDYNIDVQGVSANKNLYKTDRIFVFQKYVISNAAEILVMRSNLMKLMKFGCLQGMCLIMMEVY